MSYLAWGVYLMTNAFSVYSVYCIMQLYFGLKEKMKPLGFCCYVLCFLVMTVPSFIWENMILVLICNTMGIVFVAIYHGDNWKKCIFISSFTSIFFMAVGGVVLSVCAGLGMGHFLQYNETQFIVAIIATRTIIYSCVMAFKLKQVSVQDNGVVPVEIWLVSVIIPFCSIFPIHSIVLLKEEQYLGLMLVSIFGLLLINILTFQLYWKLNALYQSEMEHQQIEQRYEANQAQREILRQIKKSNEHLRHDLQHHLDTLTAYCQQNHNQQALEYVSRIPQALQWPEQYIYTGMDSLDAMVNYKLNVAENEHINISKVVHMPDRMNHILDVHLCAIIGNLLDNAIEAVKKVDEDRWISIFIRYDRQVLHIIIENSYNGEIRNKKGKYLTTKAEKTVHGIGLRSVDAIVNRYGGDLLLEHDENKFRVEVILFDRNMK